MSQQTAKTLFDELRRVVKEAVREELSTQLSRVQEAKQAPVSQTHAKMLGRGIDLPAADQLKAKDLRLALLLGKIPEDAGLLIDIETAARLLSIARRTLERLVSEQAVPLPIRISGRIPRWRLAELLEWIEAGCPHPRHWSYIPDSAAQTKRRR